MSERLNDVDKFNKILDLIDEADEVDFRYQNTNRYLSLSISISHNGMNNTYSVGNPSIETVKQLFERITKIKSVDLPF